MICFVSVGSTIVSKKQKMYKILNFRDKIFQHYKGCQKKKQHLPAVFPTLPPVSPGLVPTCAHGCAYKHNLRCLTACRIDEGIETGNTQQSVQQLLLERCPAKQQ